MQDKVQSDYHDPTFMHDGDKNQVIQPPKSWTAVSTQMTHSQVMSIIGPTVAECTSSIAIQAAELA